MDAEAECGGISTCVCAPCRADARRLMPKRVLPVQQDVIEGHRRAAFAVKRVMRVHCRAAADAGGNAPVNVSVLPVQPERLEQKALLVGRDTNRVEKIPVGWRQSCGSRVRWPEPVAEIAQRGQNAVRAAESPVRMEPHALRMVEWLAAMQAREHVLDFTLSGGNRLFNCTGPK